MRFPSISTRTVLLALCLLGWVAASGAPALALERGAYTMEVLVDGRPLHEWQARGRAYIQAEEDREYAIRLRNRTGGRVAVAVSVDGLNSIDARSGDAASARKWILGPYESITLDGWQTGESTARRFYFTTEDRSYGAWLGETDNLGLISAAFFREKARPRVDARRKSRIGQEAPSPRAEGSRSAAPGEAESGAAADDYAATGIGREVEHRVRQVRFRAEPRPASVLELRYEYRDALVRLGVIPPVDEPLARRERSRGFQDTGFAPDPFRPRP